jgi:hypothetical protein
LGLIKGSFRREAGRHLPHLANDWQDDTLCKGLCHLNLFKGHWLLSGAKFCQPRLERVGGLRRADANDHKHNRKYDDHAEPDEEYR